MKPAGIDISAIGSAKFARFFVAAAFIVLLCSCVDFAHAAEEQNTQSDDRSSLITKACERYDAAKKSFSEAQTRYVGSAASIYMLQVHENLLEANATTQQEQARQSAIYLYKLENKQSLIVEMLLSSNSLEDFINQTEYLNRISRACIENIQASRALSAEVKHKRADIDSTKASAKSDLEAARAELDSAEKELESAYQLREERARLGITRAQSEAEANHVDHDLSILDDGADWHMSEEAFMNQWAPRLDAYLSGSALAGQGENFAKYAWKYCIDPRWSAAISFIESSKGAICIRPYNAWGWGAADSDPYNLAAEWGSWEEAIEAHSRGLSSIFGYTVSISAARAYCPPNWENWYNTTVDQMSRI